MTEYIEITDNIISLVKYTQIKSFNDGLTKINIIHHFITEQINNQIRILKFMANTTILNTLYDEYDEDFENENSELNKTKTLDEINNYEEIREININDYNSFVEVRNFYLSELNYQHFNKLQRYMIPLLKQIELYYYDNYELDNLDEIISDIENKINYIDEFHEDIEKCLDTNSNIKIEVDKNSYDKCESTYNILKYLYDLYTSISNDK
jgi:hypothetical protein